MHKSQKTTKYDKKVLPSLGKEHVMIVLLSIKPGVRYPETAHRLAIAAIPPFSYRVVLVV